MHVEYLSHWGGNLGKEMNVNRYGYSGYPFIVFPSSGGTHDEFANFGMIEAARHHIDAGHVQFFTVESYDKESWLNNWKSPHDIALAHEAYERYILHELVPFVKHKTYWEGPMGVTGCSMGAFHAMNFQLKHPDVFQKTIALSGIYNASFFVGEHTGDPLLHQNSPADYIWLQNDGWFIDRIRSADIIIVTGRGAWEQDGMPSYLNLKQAFAEKNLGGWFDEWGDDVSHDWIWWRKQLPYYLDQRF